MKTKPHRTLLVALAWAILATTVLASAGLAEDDDRKTPPPCYPSGSDLASIWQGNWSYRSFDNVPDLSVQPNALLFGAATIAMTSPSPGLVGGTIGGSGWSLDLEGSMAYGSPMMVNFQGKGTVGGHEWIYAYVGYLVPAWPNGVKQQPAFVGSVIRVIPHPGMNGQGPMHPAGVVASFYAVKQCTP